MKPVAKVDGWKLRSLLGLSTILARMGLSATSAKAMSMPHERRAALVPPAWSLPPMPKTDVERTTMVGRGGSIPVKHFLPLSWISDATPILFLHGGGWIAGGVDALDYLCTHLCDRLGTTVTAVGYRLAPEHPYPAALEDCEDVLSALLRRSPLVDVVGDSAGGNLTAALALRMRGRSGIRKQVIIYPALDLTLASPSIDPPRHGLARRDLAQIIEKYRGGASLTDPCVSPMHAPDLRGLPATIMVTADADPLRDDGFRYAERLREAGVPVRFENYMGMPHGFLSLAKLCSAAPVCIDMIVGELQA